MANVLLVSVNNVYPVATDTVQVEADVATQEDGTTYEFNGFSTTISLKTLGVYCTVAQLNNKIIAEAEAFVEDQGHTGLTYAASYVHGGYGNLA